MHFEEIMDRPSDLCTFCAACVGMVGFVYFCLYVDMHVYEGMGVGR